MYHGIILCGTSNDMAGRTIAGFRLRTTAKEIGYNLLIIDSCVRMTEIELTNVLHNVITNDTFILGISPMWFIPSRGKKPNIEWLNDNFFESLKGKFPKLKIVLGGSDVLKTQEAEICYKNADWHITGYADDSFPRLIQLLDGKSNHGLKWMFDANGKKLVNSNKFHLISSPDVIETELEKDDEFKSYQPIPLEISRGCIFNCSFCNHAFKGVKLSSDYIRTSESIAREIKRNYELFGTTRYSILDDTINDSMVKLDIIDKAIELSGVPKFEFVGYIRPELLVVKPKMMKKLTHLGMKGVFFGIESFGDEARKAIGKGMKIEKVLDTLREYRQINSQARMHANMIIGLPGDTIKDIHGWHDFFVNNQKELFTSWNFEGLGLWNYNEISKDTTTMSDMERYPEKYGYEINIDKKEGYQVWKNKHMSSFLSNMMSVNLNKKMYDNATAGGWMVATAWNINATEDQIETLILSKLLKSIPRSVRARAVEFVKKYT